jgi:4-hydroxybenzoate polyprenyltransferase
VIRKLRVRPLKIKPGWFDAFFILRPTLFFPAWTAFLAGHRLSPGGVSEPIPFLLWLSCASGAAFLLNELADRREDALNAKLLPLWEELISARLIRRELVLLGLATIAGGIWAGWQLSALLSLFFIIAGVFYNIPPFRFKSRPILGIAACAVGGWLLFIIGARAGEGDFQAALMSGWPYALAGASVSLLTHVPDVEGDRRSGVRTFVLVYGLRATAVAATILVVLALGGGILLSDLPIMVAALVSLPFFIRFYITTTPAAAEMAVKLSVFSLAVAVGLTWLPFLIIMALYYPFARWYHHERLGLNYPTFKAMARHADSLNPLSGAQTDRLARENV